MPNDYTYDESTGKSTPNTTYSGGDGVVVNRSGTTATKNALTNVLTGTQFYDTSDSKLYVYNGSAWVSQT
jgi:hypothetical protein